MNNTQLLLERVREVLPANRKKTASDYAICNALQCQRTQLTRWKTGKGFPGNESAFRIAGLLRIDAKDVIALIEEDRADTEAQKAYWGSVPATRLRAAIVSATALASFLAAPLASASAALQPIWELSPAALISAAGCILRKIEDAVHSRLARLRAHGPWKTVDLVTA